MRFGLLGKVGLDGRCRRMKGAEFLRTTHGRVMGCLLACCLLLTFGTPAWAKPGRYKSCSVNGIGVGVRGRAMRAKIFCGATTRRGSPCQCKAIRTKRGAWRCRLHGGLSTGPKTAEGRARIAAAARARRTDFLSSEIKNRPTRAISKIDLNSKAAAEPADLTKPDIADASAALRTGQ